MNKTRLKQTYMTLNDVVNFGRHKDKTVREVIEENVDWLLWAYDEEIIKLSEQLLVTVIYKARQKKSKYNR